MRRWFAERVLTRPTEAQERLATTLDVDSVDELSAGALHERTDALVEHPDEDGPPRCAIHRTPIHDESVPIAGDTVVVQRCETDPCPVNALADLAIDRERYLAGREPEYRETRQLVDAERLQSERQVKESMSGDDENGK
ncbi:hypothetical protein [Haloarchaeobius sp. HME9146]|uniref:hypothetical protein n=1 Tax=Haloarchaeobius sp. HME9146 TaxID=2978732 RepID=UPI0021C0BAF0|nr:hypothetical protein [Haloarchaeobius sp. HME9146]MCT9097680.1 hypothetical protein [Haloarchaeobius sp. HME9146]